RQWMSWVLMSGVVQSPWVCRTVPAADRRPRSSRPLLAPVMATPGCGASLVVIPDSSPSDSLTEAVSVVKQNIDYRCQYRLYRQEAGEPAHRVDPWCQAQI